jgi:hemerythrin-like metal-binding protein
MNIPEQRYDLDFPEMQIQHEYLYALFDMIEPQSTKGTNLFRMLISEIERYILFHFSCEEHLMRLYNFPGFAVHQTDHEGAERKLVQFMDDFDNHRLNYQAMRIFFTGWLMEHSKSSDSEYITWIKDQRAKLYVKTL